MVLRLVMRIDASDGLHTQKTSSFQQDFEAQRCCSLCKSQGKVRSSSTNRESALQKLRKIVQKKIILPFIVIRSSGIAQRSHSIKQYSQKRDYPSKPANLRLKETASFAISVGGSYAACTLVPAFPLSHSGFSAAPTVLRTANHALWLVPFVFPASFAYHFYSFSSFKVTISSFSSCFLIILGIYLPSKVFNCIWLLHFIHMRILEKCISKGLKYEYLVSVYVMGANMN